MLRTSKLFSDKTGHNTFGVTMSRDRFVFLTSHICFDDEDTRSERWKYDHFAAFCDIFEAFNSNCSKHLVPSEYMVIDETLYPMHTQIAFKQYNLDKPAKYGILLKSLNESRFPHTYKLLVYAGKPKFPEEAEFFITGTENYVKSLVSRTESNVSLQGRNVSMDRLYTTITTSQWLLSKGITSIGTIMSNRIGLPDDAKLTKGRAIHSTKVYWEQEKEDLVLTSYSVNTSQGLKNVLMLSTVQPLLGVTADDDKKKPAIMKLYDFTKGGTDVPDQKMKKASTKPKSSRWTIVSFCYVLDQSRINAQSIYALNKGTQVSKMSSFDFGWDLAESLILLHVRC